MSGAVSWNLQLAVRDGRLGDFRSLMEEMVESTRSEPGTRAYEWFLSEDGAKCYILELYRDSQALSSHLANIRDLYAPLFELAQITRIEVFGAASEEVKQAHIPGTVFHDYWAGTRC